MARQRTAKGPNSPAWFRGYPRGALAIALLAGSSSWRQEPGKGANGRGCQVAEVWLIRK